MNSRPDGIDALAGVRATAWEDALRAQEASGITIRQLSPGREMQDVQHLLDSVWKPRQGASTVNVEVLQSLATAGSYVGGAFAGATLVGICAGLWGPPGGGELHSHIAAVSGSMRGRHLGFALKLHQRAAALDRSVTKITWTFDPLVSRNAYFNLVKLGATPMSYLVNHYGSMNDELNRGDESDRLLVAWDVASPEVAERCSRSTVREAAHSAPAFLTTDLEGRPVRRQVGAEVVAVEIPSDIERARREDFSLALAWRLALRDALSGLVARGYTIDAFDLQRSAYVLERKR